MSAEYDAIIIGAGHNGLVAAAYLARAGFKTLVLEGRTVVGGAAATEEIFPDYRVNTGSDDVSLFQEKIVSDLFLKMHGLELREGAVSVFAPQPDGTALTLWPDLERSAKEIARFNEADARRFPSFVKETEAMAHLLRQMFLRTPPNLKERNLGDAFSWGRMGWDLKRRGDRHMMEFLRRLPLPISETLDEWFESDALKGALGTTGVRGMHQGPRAAGTTLMFLYQNSNGLNRPVFARGGTGRLSQALAAAARSDGAEIRTGAPVGCILLEGGRVQGVRLAGEAGQEITARAVLSSADPRRTFFDLVGPTQLAPRFMRKVRNIIYRGSTAKVILALNGLPTFNGQEEEAQLSGYIRICPSLEYLERAYDDAKYGRISTRPTLEMTIPTLSDPSLAPPGRHILSIRMQYAPYAIRQRNWEEERERLGDLVLDTVAQYAPNVKEIVVRRRILTPLDYEDEYGLTEGSIYHGQMGLDQLLVMRPVPGWSRYRTPIDNLFLCGSGTHPGGGLTGAPGHNAAREVAQALDHSSGRKPA